jgi:hypothetical protein
MPTFSDNSTIVTQPGQCYQSKEMNGIDKERVKHTRLAFMRRQRSVVFHRPDPGPGPVPEPDTPDQPPQPLPTPPIPPEPPVRREQSKSFRN